MSVRLAWLDPDAQELAAVACVRGGAHHAPTTVSGVVELVDVLLARADVEDGVRVGWALRLREVADELGDGLDALPAGC